MKQKKNDIGQNVIVHSLSLKERARIYAQWCAERKYYFSQEIKALKPEEEVMEKYYNIKHNNYQPVLLKKDTIESILNKYGQNGYVILSSNDDFTTDYYINKTRRMIGDIKASGFSYLPVYRKTRQNDAESLVYFEPSFCVFNIMYDDNTNEDEMFRFFSFNMCDKYELYFNSINLEAINECYVNPLPTCYIEEQRRRGEIMIWRV